VFPPAQINDQKTPYLKELQFHDNNDMALYGH